MAISNGYATLAELKARLGISDSDDDTELEDVVEAASRQIDAWCGRRFYSASETRYYTPRSWDVLYIDDLASVTTLKSDEDGDGTFEITWATTDYNLMPYNAATDGEPYTFIERSVNGDYAFIKLRRSVEIAGSFGWSAVPHEVREACLIQAARLFKRKDAPHGVIGGGEFALTMPRLDPDVQELIVGLRRFM